MEVFLLNFYVCSWILYVAPRPIQPGLGCVWDNSMQTTTKGHSAAWPCLAGQNCTLRCSAMRPTQVKTALPSYSDVWWRLRSTLSTYSLCLYHRDHGPDARCCCFGRRRAAAEEQQTASGPWGDIVGHWNHASGPCRGEYCAHFGILRILDDLTRSWMALESTRPLTLGNFL